MIKGLYTSAAGMLPLEYRQNLVANNLSNTNTSGYKQDRSFVHELLTADLYLNEHGLASTGQPAPLVNISPPAFRASVGDSSRVVAYQTDFSPGNFEVTDNDLNLAIEGDGFFEVTTPNGVRYTRNGYFSVNAAGNLVTGNGFVVQGNAGPINVQGRKMTVLQSGAVIVDGAPRGTLRIRDFPKPYQLTKVGSSLFIARDTGIAPNPRDFKVRQGVLENANSDPIDQMVSMIEIARMYELNQRAIRLQDETLQQAVTQVGRV